MDTLPTINRVLSMVIQYERQQSPNLVFMEEQNDLVNVAEKWSFFPFGKNCWNLHDNGKGNLPYDARKSNKVCTYCGRVGHTINECYGKHKYPLGHSRYPDRPWYHNHGFGSTMNNVATGRLHEIEEEDKKDKDAHRLSLNMTLAQHQRLISLL